MTLNGVLPALHPTSLDHIKYNPECGVLLPLLSGYILVRTLSESSKHHTLPRRGGKRGIHSGLWIITTGVKRFLECYASTVC